MYEVNWIAILAAGIANIVIGMVWYNQKVLGSAWMRAARLNAAEMNASMGRMVASTIGAGVGAMITAYVMTYFGMAWGVFDVIGAIELAIWIWLGFVVPTQLGVVLWEQKPWGLFFINAGYWFVSLIVMAIILVVVQ